jgi:NADH-quinone oxidoreductase E subunit
VSHLSTEVQAQAEALIALYPERRSALIPLCHLAQQQDGWLRPEAMREIAELVGVTAAEVQGTATFYDMLHTEPVGTYVVSVCTNIACLLGGALELLEHAESSLGVRAGGTTSDGVITLEESECLADCDRTPCVQVNHRFMGGHTPDSFDQLMTGLRNGSLSDNVPPHGTLVRVQRNVGLMAEKEAIVAERAAMAEAQATRAKAAEAAKDAADAKAAPPAPAPGPAQAPPPDAPKVAGPPPTTTSVPASTPPSPTAKKPDAENKGPA